MHPTRMGLPCLLVISVLWVGVAAAEPVRAGDPLPAIELEDQHGVTATIDAGVRYVLFTRDMDGGKVVQEVLQDDGQQRLDAVRAVYVSDISRMPGLVTRLFALPSLRKRGYRILLDRDGTATATIPSEPGTVTVLELVAGTVEGVRTIRSAEGLGALFAD